MRTKKNKFDAAVLRVFGELDEELNDDYVELWHVPKSLRRSVERVSDEELMTLARAVLVSLVNSGAQFGRLANDGGFEPWERPGDVERVLAEWRELGRDPNMGDICWINRD